MYQFTLLTHIINSLKSKHNKKVRDLGSPVDLNKLDVGLLEGAAPMGSMGVRKIKGAVFS